MITETKIKNTARDLNSKLGLDPQIDMSLDLRTLIEMIQRIIGTGLIEPTDVFPTDTDETIRALSVMDLDEIEKELNIEDPQLPDSLEDQINASKKIRELKDICKANDEFASIRGELAKFQDIEILRDKMTEMVTTAKILPEPVPEELTPLVIKPLFKKACPVLTKQEYEDLERLILKDKRVINPILTWHGAIVDGHNRYEISQKHKIPYTTKELVFQNEDEVLVWIKENAISQRNLSDFARYELVKDIEYIVKTEAKKRQSLAGQKVQIDEPPIDTRKEIADKINVSPAQVGKMKEIDQKADERIKRKLREGRINVAQAYRHVKERENPKKLTDKDKLEMAAKGLDKWIAKYQDDDLFLEFTDEVTAIAVRMRESLPF